MSLKTKKNIIIQAGGLGSRLGNRTKNKPKCLVEVSGKNILDYSLEMFKEDAIFIIADYKSEILRRYIKNFYNDLDITIIVTNHKGTSSGLREISKMISNDNEILLMWSDLVLLNYPNFKIQSDIKIFTTDDVLCRYCEINKKITKNTTTINGIVGIFLFKNKEILGHIPLEGSLVSGWLMDNRQFSIDFEKIEGVKEFGTLDLVDKEKKNYNTRFFNKIEDLGDNFLIKMCIDDNYKHLQEKEIFWYKFVNDKNFPFIPKIKSTDPLVISKILGHHPYEKNGKREDLEKIIKSIKLLHNLKIQEYCKEDCSIEYQKKPIQRVKSVCELLPFFNFEEIKINGKKCSNPFHMKNIDNFMEKIDKIEIRNFSCIHGDPTFSNLLIDDKSCFLLDPRGYFGNKKIFGDPDYDWAKIYYSLCGNYDQLNMKNYELEIINDYEINFIIKSNGWEHLEDDFFSLIDCKKEKIKLINSTIWFSLCGYIRNDYDSILISFLKGVEIWNDLL